MTPNGAERSMAHFGACRKLIFGSDCPPGCRARAGGTKSLIPVPRRQVSPLRGSREEQARIGPGGLSAAVPVVVERKE
jgi:hypothetical protein